MNSFIQRLAIAYFCILYADVSIAQTLQKSGASRIAIQTAQRGIPSSVTEWEDDRLNVDASGKYSVFATSEVPFTGLAVGWQASDPKANPSEFHVEIRSRTKSGSWNRLLTQGDKSPAETPSGLFWSHLYVTLDGSLHNEYEVRIKAPENVSVRFLRISVADASDGLNVDHTLVKSSQQKSVEATTSVPQPTIIPRSDWWGSLPSGEINSPRWSPVTITISHAVIHHTVNYNNPPNPAQIVRQIWDDHANNQGWGDIGYNFLIDQFGNIYQGRYNPSLSTTDTRAGHAGGGGGGANAVSVGIALIGQFHSQLADPPAGIPDSRALRCLEKLIAWRFDQRGLDPLGTANIITYWGTQNLDRITGHRLIGASTGA
ncbi:MAG: N-acetylmuramoyl-L-alanine amidase, partial [Anaerolineae bacterium]|nr:N-acetylmuramoyl-L-alanine amidase [Anaerolineae bacterium]